MSVELDIEVTAPGGGVRLAVATTLAAPATGVFGPSGAGKTTLLHVLAGLVRPTRGRVVVDGVVLDDTAAGIHVPPHRRRIGLVFQHGRLFPHLTVEANLRYGERLQPAAERRVPFAALVELFALGPLLARRPATLSGGERQRVALGRALLAAPRLLLLDEPLAALDHGLRRQILPYLKAVRHELGVPCIHVSHDLGELLHLTRDLLLLEGGRMAARGDLATLAADPAHLDRLHDAGLVNVLPATVAAHLPDDGLTRLDLAAGRAVTVPLLDRSVHPPGSACTVLLRPADLILAGGPPEGLDAGRLSLQNRLPGKVLSVTGTPRRTIVAVAAGDGPPLLAEVSGRAARLLGLAPGTPVTCLFKAQVAVCN